MMGRVDIDVNAALGILQDQPDDELLELAYFKMRVSLRNTVQNLAGKREKGEVPDSPVVVDTFAISILNPHLYVQSSAFEQGGRGSLVMCVEGVASGVCGGGH